MFNSCNYIKINLRYLYVFINWYDLDRLKEEIIKVRVKSKGKLGKGWVKKVDVYMRYEGMCSIWKYG